jgi:hypothetical protein
MVGSDRMQLPKQQFSSFAVLLLLVTSFVVVSQTPQAAKAKPPRSVTGHYVMRRAAFHNTLDVQQLPGGKIKFDLIALWVSQNNSENVHNGEIQAIVKFGKRRRGLRRRAVPGKDGVSADPRAHFRER